MMSRSTGVALSIIAVAAIGLLIVGSLTPLADASEDSTIVLSLLYAIAALGFLSAIAAWLSAVVHVAKTSRGSRKVEWLVALTFANLPASWVYWFTRPHADSGTS